MVGWTYPLRHLRLVDRGRRRRCSWWFICTIQISIRVAAVIGICTLYYSVEPAFRYLLRNIKPSIDHVTACHGTDRCDNATICDSCMIDAFRCSSLDLKQRQQPANLQSCTSNAGICREDGIRRRQTT